MEFWSRQVSGRHGIFEGSLAEMLRFLPKTSRALGVLTVLASKSLSRAGVVQILWSSSKSAPNMQRGAFFFAEIILARRRGVNFAELNFQKCSEHAAWCFFFAEIALARRRGANFAELNFQKCSEPAAWCKFYRHLRQPILRTTSLFGADFASLRSHEIMEKHSISCNSYPPKSLMSRICAVKRLCCLTSMLQDLAATFSIVGS